MSVRPFDCEAWCHSWGYEACTCELTERQAAWDRTHRAPDAAELPTARLIRHHRKTL